MAPGGAGIERLQAHLHGQAFAAHRHDTYAIGITLSGVQTFRFRGQRWYCLPGQVHILHPDEAHDGGAGTSDGFGYRMVYIDPALIQEALSGQRLPFVANPVLDAVLPAAAGISGFWDIECEIDDVVRAELSVAAASLLVAASGGSQRAGPLHLDGLRRVRDCIAAAPAERHPMDRLERVSGLDRWTLARQFRAAFGTSPSRFRTLRQLDHVRRLMECGTPLAQAASEAGFADQSHMSRRFKAAYGLTPASWLAALG